MIATFCDRVFWGVCNLYWNIYKTQLPSGFGCKDTGHEVFNNLTMFGKLLYLIRPLMLRSKQKKIGHQHPIKVHKKTRIEPDYNKTKQYYTLISDSLHKVFVKDIVHIGTQSYPTQLHLYDDGTSISTFLNDLELIKMWTDGERIAYLLTIDLCCFPDYHRLAIPENIRRVLQIDNAGGNSEVSEMFSMYHMYLKLSASDFVPEMEINYQYKTSICDYVMTVNGHRVGVSTTRAMCYPFTQSVTTESLNKLLHKKLNGIIIAKQTVLSRFQFDLSLIHIWCKSWIDAEIVRKTFISVIDDDIYGIYGNIHVLCTVCPNDFIYTNELHFE
jgi:hypothetical protein